MSRSEWPRCTHRPKANRVTNLPDEIKWEPGMEHMSSWICDRRPCVLEAMACVERVTGEPAYVYGPLAHMGVQP